MGVKVMDSEQAGRNRRRKGLINWGRRVLYGVALSLGTGHAGAATPGPEAKPARPAPPSSAVNTTGAVLLAHGYAVSLAGAPTDPLDPHMRRAGSELLPYAGNAALNNVLLTASISDDLNAMRNGVGIDLKLPDFGSFYLNLYTRKNPRGRGKRWQLLPDDGGAAPVWSMGGAVNLVRNTQGGRHLEIAPQLNLNLARAFGAPGQMEANLQRGSWNNANPLAGPPEKVLQLSFRWRF